MFLLLHRHGDHPLWQLIDERFPKSTWYDADLEAGEVMEGGGGEGVFPQADPEAGITQQVARQVSEQVSKLGQDPELSLPGSSQHVTPDVSCHEETTPNHAQWASSSPAPQSPAHQQTTTSSSPTSHATSSPAHLLAAHSTAQEQVDRGLPFKKSLWQSKTSDSAHMGGGKLSKKPSMLSVLLGSQYNNSISQGTIQNDEIEM